MKLISMSVWGDHPMYWEGALANAQLYRTIYPGWDLRLYTDTQNDFTRKCAELGAEIRLAENMGGIHGMFWRLLPIGEPGVDAVIIRDADSRLNPREAAAVDAWLQSGKAAHTMRDHPLHLKWPINGGMWGIRGRVIPNIADRIAKWGRWEKKFDDMRFLEAVIWPLIADNCAQHVTGLSRWGGVPFPAHPPSDSNYVGQVYYEGGRKDVSRDAPADEYIGRNSPCRCGSGLRFKDCHGTLQQT